MLVTGGDTLLAFMQRVGLDKLIPSGGAGTRCSAVTDRIPKKKICHPLQVRGIRIRPPALGSERKIELAEVRGGRGMLDQVQFENAPRDLQR